MSTIANVAAFKIDDSAPVGASQITDTINITVYGETPNMNVMPPADVRTVQIQTVAAMPNIVVSPINPGLAVPGLWIQTGLGDSGQDMTFWIEDGQ